MGGWRRALEEQRGLVDEPQRARVKFPELFDGRFIARELDQVAAGQEIAQGEFLGQREQRAGLEFVKKFLGGAFRGAH